MRLPIGLGALVGIIGFCLSGTVAEPPAPSEQFVETFDRLDPTVWSTVGRGRVKVANGVLSVTDCFVRGGEQDWTNYVLEFRARAPEGAEQVQIWAGFRCSGRNRRYALALRGGNCDDIYLCRYAPGGNDRMLALEPLDFHPEVGRWYRLRVVVQGDYIAVYLDDEERPRVSVIDGRPLGSGQVVLGGGWIETEFDDLRVRRLPDKTEEGSWGAFHPRAIKINFQDTADQLIPGWIPVDGRPYDKTRGYGWDAENGMRRRNATKDILKDTLAVVAHGRVKATFFYDLPNGEYVLTLCGGDPSFASHLEAYVMGEEVPFVHSEVPKGSYETVTHLIRIHTGQLRVTFKSNHPQRQAGGSICYMVLENRADVPDKWNKWKWKARDETAAEKARQEERRSYRPVELAQLSTPRHEVLLTGKWLFLPDYEVQPETKPFLPATADENWHVMQVPAFWNPIQNWLHGKTGVSDNYRQKEKARCENYTFDHARTDSAWYRHWITLPEKIEGKHFKLCFDAVAKVADVWVNGKYVGGHVGMFGAFELDVTKVVKPGRNLVVVRVQRRKAPASAAEEVLCVAVTVEVTRQMLESLPHGIYSGDPGGIWQPVKLVVTDPVRIDEVFVRPRTDSADVDVTVGNYADREAAVEVGLAIRPCDGKGVVYKSPEPLKVVLPAGAVETVTLKTPCLPVKTWSPEQPNLYTLAVSLLREGKSIDRTTTVMGFRTFEVRGNRFYLNGKPYWLRGANHAPAGLAPNDARLADRFMKLMHDGNQMVTRAVCAPWTEVWLAAADRRGVAVSYEGPWPWLMLRGPVVKSELLKVWRDEQAALVRRYRNHPSIIMWTMNNEMKFTMPGGCDKTLRMEKWKILSSAIDMVRQLDPTRPIVADSCYVRRRDDWEKNLRPAGIDDGDIDDIHAYYGWYWPSPFALFGGGWTTGANPDRPFISQEYSTGYPNNDTGHPTRRYLLNHYTPQAWVGDWAYEDHDPAVFLSRHAFITKELAEVIRRTSHNAAGVLLFSNVCWFRNVYDAERIEPYPVYDAARQALAPVLVSAELFGRNYYAGSSIDVRVCIVNDQVSGEALPRGELRWRIANGPAVLSHGSVPVEAVEHYGRRWMNVRFDLPLPEELATAKANCRLVLSLHHQDKKTSENAYDLTLARPDWVAVDQSVCKRSIKLFDPCDQMGRALKAIGVKAQTTGDLREVERADCDLLIVAGADLLSKRPAGWLELRSLVEQGGTVLLIHPGKHLQTLLPEYVKSVLDEKGEIVNMRVPESGVFDEIRPLDLSWWNVGSRQTPYACRRSFRLRRRDEVSVLCTYLRPHGYLSSPREQLESLGGSPLFEIELGKGRLLVSEMATEAGTRDPIAARVLVNIVTYLTSTIDRGSTVNIQ